MSMTPEKSRAFSKGQWCTLLYCPKEYKDEELQHYFEMGYYGTLEESSYAEYTTWSEDD